MRKTKRKNLVKNKLITIKINVYEIEEIKTIKVCIYKCNYEKHGVLMYNCMNLF